MVCIVMIVVFEEIFIVNGLLILDYGFWILVNDEMFFVLVLVSLCRVEGLGFDSV